MAWGLSAYLRNKFLECLRGNSFSVATVYIQMHTGDPGPNGTANVSAGASGRKAVTYSAAASGSMTTSAGTGNWTNSGVTETLAGYSRWDAPTSGNFLGSVQSAAAKTWSSGETVAVASDTLSVSPAAA